MSIVLVLALLLVGYFFLTADVSIVAFRAQGVPTAQIPEQFEKIKASVTDKTFQGMVYGAEPIGSVEDYALVTYTVRLSNQCLVPIDMIELQVIPDPVDVLQLGDNQPHALGPKTEGDITASILTAKDSHTIRELVVTYYVWGVSFRVKETYTGQ